MRSTFARLWRPALALLVVAVVVRLFFAGSPSSDVMELPDAGSVRAGLLDDGTPVFLVHSDDDAVDVVEAFAPTAGPLRSLLGYCPRTEDFVDAHSGQRFAASELVQREYERLEGRGGAEDPVQIGAPVADEGESPSPSPSPSPSEERFPPPVSCRPAERPLVEPTPTETPVGIAGPPRPEPLSRILDHSFLARRLSTPLERWQVTDGYLLISPGGGAQWCRVEPVLSPPSCADPAPVEVRLGLSAEETGDAWTVIGGPLAVRAEDRVVVEAAVLPRSTWRGGHLAGTATYTASWLRLDVDRGVLEVAVLEEALPCTTQPDVAIAQQPVDGDTAFVDGESDPGELAALVAPRASTAAPGEDLRVRVTVDNATCVALSVATLP